MRKLAGALLIALSLPAGARAVPPAAAGAIASDNVDFVANLPDVAAVGGKILGDTMYVTTSQGLRIFDVSQGIPVLLGALALPHWENEAVDTNGRILIVSADHAIGPNVIYVVDVSEPRAPLLLSSMQIPNSAHTATCILDCRYVWASGGDVIDLADPQHPELLGRSPARGHKVVVDDAGYAWVGSRVYDTSSYGPDDVFDPTRYAAGSFGWHNSLRPDARAADPARLADATLDPGELVLGTDEQALAEERGCTLDGAFRTSHLREENGQRVVATIQRWIVDDGTAGESKPASLLTCSSHWFDYRDGVVADAWYEQGVRFLDVTGGSIRQIGFYMPVLTEAWMATFKDVTAGPLPGRYVYVFDYARGLDVLRFTGAAGDSLALAPRFNSASRVSAPDSAWGGVCRIPSAR